MEVFLVISVVVSAHHPFSTMLTVSFYCASYDIRPAKASGKMGKKTCKLSRLNETGNRLTFQTHTHIFTQTALGRAVFYEEAHCTR